MRWKMQGWRKKGERGRYGYRGDGMAEGMGGIRGT